MEKINEKVLMVELCIIVLILVILPAGGMTATGGALGSAYILIADPFFNGGVQEYHANEVNKSIVPEGETNGLIQDAVNAASNGDTINLLAKTYNENVVVWKSLQLIGAGKGKTIVDSGGNGPAFKIVPVNTVTITVTISNMSITNGGGTKPTGCAGDDCNINTHGGGIYNLGGTLNLNNSLITGNKATHGGGIDNELGIVNMNAGSSITDNKGELGGGIENRGKLNMNAGSSITGNHARRDLYSSGGLGGGIYNDDGGMVNMVAGSYIANNEAEHYSGDNYTGLGGGIWNEGIVWFKDSNGNTIDTNDYYNTTNDPYGFFHDPTIISPPYTAKGNTPDDIYEAE